MRLEQIEPIRAFRGMSQAAPVGPKTAVVRNLESNLTCRCGLHARRGRARAYARTSQNLAVSRKCANVSSSCLFSMPIGQQTHSRIGRWGFEYNFKYLPPWACKKLGKNGDP